MKTPEMDLLDLCACRLGCQYLSDLRGLQGWQRAQLAGVLRGVAAGEAPLGYLTGEGPAASPEEARAWLIGRLAPEGTSPAGSAKKRARADVP